MSFNPAYIFRDSPPVAYQYWPSDEESQFFCDACADGPSECEFPLYSDDLEAARNLEPLLCERCERVLF